MRLKAVAKGIDLTLLTPIEEQDLLQYMLSQHDFETHLAVAHNPHITKDNVGSVSDNVEKLMSPWRTVAAEKKRVKEKKAMDNLFDKTAFLYDRDIRTGQPFIRMMNKHEK